MKKKLAVLLTALMMISSTTAFMAMETSASAIKVTKSDGTEVTVTDGDLSMGEGYASVATGRGMKVEPIAVFVLPDFGGEETITIEYAGIKASDNLRVIYAFGGGTDIVTPISVEDGSLTAEVTVMENSAVKGPFVIAKYLGEVEKPGTPSVDKNTIVSTTDSTVSVNDASNVLPAGTTMNTEKVASGATYEAAVAAVANKVENKEKVAVYEINLEAAGVELHQLAGKVKVTVDVPFAISEGKTIKVYRLEGTELIPCNTTVANGKVTFETDHFSTYVFVEESVDNGSIYYIAQANGVNPYASGAADATVTAVTSPKTGDTNVALIVAMFALATAGVVVVRRRVAR